MQIRHITPLVLCGASASQIRHIGALRICFEVVSGLKVNLSKSVLVPVGSLSDVDQTNLLVYWVVV
jgi:hypothetical protein